MTKLKEQEVELRQAKLNAANSHHLAEARSMVETLSSENNILKKKFFLIFAIYP